MAKADMGRKSAARAALKAQRRARRKAKNKNKPVVVAATVTTTKTDDAQTPKDTGDTGTEAYDPAKDPILKAADKAEVIEEKGEKPMGTKKPPMPKKKKKKDEDEE